MSHTTVFRVDGTSPLTRYVDLLIGVPETLELLVKRDAEAVRLLTELALPNAQRRAERWYWDRQRGKQLGKVVCTPRIWTRRDERRVNLQRGLCGGTWPACRVARYLHSVSRMCDPLFRDAVAEAREDAAGSVTCGKLDAARMAFKTLLGAARSISQGHGGESNLREAQIPLWDIVCELMVWTRLPSQSPGTAENDGAAHAEAEEPPAQVGKNKKRRRGGKQSAGTKPRKNSAKPKLEAAFAKLQGYDGQGIDGTKQVGRNELRDEARVGNRATDKFFEHWFGGYSQYESLITKKNYPAVLAKTREIQREPVPSQCPDQGQDSEDRQDLGVHYDDEPNLD